MILAHEMITYNIDKICVLQIQMCNPPTRFEENPVTFLLPGKYGKHAIGNKHEVKTYIIFTLNIDMILLSIHSYSRSGLRILEKTKQLQTSFDKEWHGASD